MFCNLWQGEKGSPKPEHEWPREDYWIWSWLDSRRFAKLEDELEPGASKLEDELETRASEPEDKRETGANESEDDLGQILSVAGTIDQQKLNERLDMRPSSRLERDK